MKVEVVVCDLCGKRLADGDRPGQLLIRAGKVKVALDVDEGCAQRVAKAARRPAPEKPVERDEGDRLGRVLATANRGLEAYADGADARTLADALRDVVSDAARNARVR